MSLQVNTNILYKFYPKLFTDINKFEYKYGGNLKLVEYDNNHYYTPAVFNYEQAVECLIRSQLTVGQELAILRQRDTKPNEFQEYFNFVEACKTAAQEYMQIVNNWEYTPQTFGDYLNEETN